MAHTVQEQLKDSRTSGLYDAAAADKLGGLNKTPPGIKRQNQHWLRTSLEMYMFVPLAVIVLESFFNLAGIGQSELVMPDLQLGSKHIPGKLVTWHLEGYSHGRLSSAGLRDVEHTVAKPAGTKRIVFLGDSYTEGLQVDLKDVFAKRIEERLNTDSNQRWESINFGCSAYSTGQEALLFEKEAAQYKPDLVVVLYTPGDTRENSVSPTKRAEADPRPYFYLDSNNALQQDDGILTLNHEKLKPRPLRDFLRRHSTIFGAWTQTNLSLKMSDRLYFRTNRLLGQIGDRLAKLTAGKNAPPAPGLLPPSWQEPDQLAVSEALLKRLNSDAKNAGGKLVLVAYPDIARGDAQYVQARARFEELAHREGFGYLDLSEAFKHDQNPNNLFIKVHFSKLGHDLTASQLATYLKKAGYVPN